MHFSANSKSLILLREWARRIKLTRNLAFAFAAGALAAGIATYITITEKSNPLGPDPKLVVNFLLADLIFLLGLATIITVKVVNLWLERLKGSVGSRLQTRIILMFCLVSIIPTIIVASFSALFFNFGIQTWFNERVSTALEESVAVAESYLTEHKEAIRGDALAMANDLNREAYLVSADPIRFEQLVSAQAAIRSLPEAVVFQPNGNHILARSNLSFSLLFDVDKISPEAYKRADSGEVVIITNENNDNEERVRALVKLDNFFETYLLVGRLVDSRIISHIESTKGSVNEYKRLKNTISRLQIKFSVVFIGVALLLLLSAIWFGMVIASELVKPISSLVTATERIKEGDLKARVDEGPENDEIGTLGRAFNRMADQLEKQRIELKAAERSRAWSDVARRIAHEIKNPLTPIHLSAERLKKKYLAEIKSSPENFVRYIDTIIAHVTDIGRMVEEFAEFARMPAPIMANNDICKLAQDVAFSQKSVHPEIYYEIEAAERPIIINCDPGQISQVLANILKNAAEGIEAKKISDPTWSDEGKIRMKISRENDALVEIEISDNGKGFPNELIDKLTEPYITTREKGTGLGLAIVKKIMFDHHGKLILKNIDNGACVSLLFQVKNKNQE